MNFDEHETASLNAMSQRHPGWEQESAVLAMLAIGGAVERLAAATERLAVAQEESQPRRRQASILRRPGQG